MISQILCLDSRYVFFVSFNFTSQFYFILQKPTAQKFYARILSKVPESLQNLTFMQMKNKMQAQKILYTQALGWKNSTGNGLTEEDGELCVEGSCSCQ